MNYKLLYIASIILLLLLSGFLIYLFIQCNNKKCDYPPKKNKAELIKNIMDEIQKKIDIEINDKRSKIDPKSDIVKIDKINNNINVTITTSVRDESNAIIMNNVNIKRNFSLPNLENVPEYDLEYILHKKDMDFIFKILLSEYGYNESIDL